MLKKYFKMLGMLLVYYGIPVAVCLIMSYTPFILEPIKPILKLAPTMFLGIGDPIIIFLLFLFMRLIRKKSMAEFCNFVKPGTLNMVLSCLIGFFMAVFTYSLINTDFGKTTLGSLGVSIKYFIINGNIILLTYAVLINSISKEIQFRGLMFNEIRGVLPVSVAAIMQALLYASQVKSSSDWLLTGYAFIGAIVFAIVFYLGKSIWSSILTQICCTMGMVLLDRTIIVKLFSPQISWFLFIASILIITFLVTQLYRNGKKWGTAKSKTAKLEG